MPIAAQKTKNKIKQPDTVEFNKTYTQNSEGFYIRNVKPSSGRLSPERIAENLRYLLREDPKTDDPE